MDLQLFTICLESIGQIGGGGGNKTEKISIIGLIFDLDDDA